MRIRINKPLLLAVMAVCFGIFNSACTRKADKEKTGFVLEIPDSVRNPISLKAYNPKSKLSMSGSVATLSNLALDRLFINVWDGPNAGRLLAKYTASYCHHTNTGMICSAAPSAVSMNVERGPGRFIQVLALYKDLSGSGSEPITYGETSVDLTGDSATAAVTVVEVLNDTDAMANMQIQYLTGDSLGYTGPVEVYVQPSLGKPKMKLFDTSMYGGYFSHFFFANKKVFSFFLPERGEWLMDPSGVTLGETAAGGSVNVPESMEHLIKVVTPPLYSYNSGNGGSYHRKEEVGFYVGYIKSPSAPASVLTNKKAYYPTAPSPVVVNNYTYYGTMPTGSPAPTPTPTNLLKYNAKAGNGQVGRVQIYGGLPYPSPTPNPSLVAYKDYITFKIDRITNGEGVIPMMAAYREFDAGHTHAGKIIGETTSAGNITVEWKYLTPELFLGTNAVAGTAVILFSAASPEAISGAIEAFSTSSGVDCVGLMGALSNMADVTNAIYYVDQPTETLTNTALPAGGTSHKSVLCPYKLVGTDKVPIGGGAIQHSGNNPSFENKFMLSINGKDFSWRTIPYNVCTQMKLTKLDGTNMPQTVTTDTTIVMSQPGASNYFYSDSNCTTQETTYTIQAGTSDTNSIWYKQGSSDGYRTFMGAIGSYTQSFQFVIPQAGPPDKLMVVNNMTEYEKNRCYEMFLGFSGSGSYTRSNDTDLTARLDLFNSGTDESASKMTVYSTPHCLAGTEVASRQFVFDDATPESLRAFGVKFSHPSASFSRALKVNLVAGTVTFTDPVIGLSVGGAATADIGFPNDRQAAFYTASSCHTAYLFGLNDVGAQVGFTGATSFNVEVLNSSGTPVNFYDAENCSGNSVSSVSVTRAAGENMQIPVSFQTASESFHRIHLTNITGISGLSSKYVPMSVGTNYDNIYMTTAPQVDDTAGNVCNTFTFEFRYSASPTPTATEQVVRLSSWAQSGGIQFFDSTDTGCTTPLNSLVVPSGTQTVTFKAKSMGTTVNGQPYKIKVDAGPGSRTLTISNTFY